MNHAGIKFIEIQWQSPRYQQTLELRDRWLRAPLGLKFDAAELQAEQSQHHFGVVGSDDRLVACVVAVPIAPTLAKVRQMVVDQPYQGQGVGAKLLEGVEVMLRERGFQTIELNAREHAVGFYEKQGYLKQGDSFIEVTIPHWKMVKAL